MDSGIARQRRQYTARTRQGSVEWELSNEELWLFEGFLEHILGGGVGWFDIDMPFGSDGGEDFLKTNTARFVNGEYKVQLADGNKWTVTATLEVLDPDVMTAAQAATEFS